MSVDKENSLKGSFEKALDIKKPALSWCLFWNWCPDAESNHGHGDFQSPALPTELSGQQWRCIKHDSRLSVNPFYKIFLKIYTDWLKFN